MKRATLIFLTTLFISAPSFSQVNPNAIGIRFRSDFGASGAEVSYQRGFGDRNRLELDLGVRGHRNWRHVGIAAIFHWDWNIVQGLNWYVGPGVALGFYSHRHLSEDGLTLGIGGQIGIEYDFNAHNVPLLLSLDWRPMWGFYKYSQYEAFGYGGGLSIRYTF